MVTDDEVCLPSYSGNRHLEPCSSQYFCLGEASLKCNTPDTILERCVNDNNKVKKNFKAGLKNQGCFDNHKWSPLCGREMVNDALNSGNDRRMNDRIQILEERSISEDYSGEPLSIKGTIGEENGGSELLHEL